MSHVPDKTQTNLLSYRDKETNENMENLYAANLVIKLHRKSNNKGAGQIAHLHRLAYAYGVHLLQNRLFSQGDPYDVLAM